jgi:hypothetical protein
LANIFTLGINGTRTYQRTTALGTSGVQVFQDGTGTSGDFQTLLLTSLTSTNVGYASTGTSVFYVYFSTFE